MAIVGTGTIADFKKELLEFKKECEKELEIVTKKVVDYIYEMLILNSPYPQNPGTIFRPLPSPYSAGAYVLSHRIGINRKSGDSPVDFGEADLDDPKMINVGFAAHEIARAEAANKIPKIHAYDNIYFTNKNRHAVSVEYGLWNVEGATAPAYLTYELTLSDAKLNFNSLVKKWAKLKGI